VKRFVVVALERMCTWFCWLPPHRCRLAALSARLDEVWGTGVWVVSGPDELTDEYVCDDCGPLTEDEVVNGKCAHCGKEALGL